MIFKINPLQLQVTNTRIPQNIKRPDIEKEGLKSAFLILPGMTAHRDVSGQLWGKLCLAKFWKWGGLGTMDLRTKKEFLHSCNWVQRRVR